MEVSNTKKNKYVRMISAFAMKDQRIPRFGPTLHAESPLIVQNSDRVVIVIVTRHFVWDSVPSQIQPMN